ncbi:hypothetical protein AGMMS50239_32940 [Bacteroidia bacterium]|nr:hypothetical protein AGMMS50239_32940 [Bacteroidia bacterium]
MATKTTVMQRLMKIVSRTWELKSGEQLDPGIMRMLEAFAELFMETKNDIERIREGILLQVAEALTPDNLAAVIPAHAILKTMPSEPVLEIGKHTSFYTNQLPDTYARQGMKTMDFAPVTESIRLVRGEITSLLCENNLYTINRDGEKDLSAKAATFCPGLNRCLWIGFTLDNLVESLKGIHFYFEFPNTASCYELYDLLGYTHWSINGQELNMIAGINRYQEQMENTGEDVFSRYNPLNTSDRDIMDLYRKQFLHIGDPVRTASLEKYPFPQELQPFFPERVNEMEAQYWLKVKFPAFFKSDDINDTAVHLNAFPVSNKNHKNKTWDRNKSFTSMVSLMQPEGEYFFGIDRVEDSRGQEYRPLPYTSAGQPPGGTYSLKRGTLERFNARDLTESIEYVVGKFHSEAAIFSAMKIDNIHNTIMDIEREIMSIQEKISRNNTRTTGSPVYLIVDTAEEDDPYINIDYWTTNGEAANGLNYGTILNPLHSLPVEKDSCILLKKTRGGKTIPKNEDVFSAYKYALTTHDKLYSAADYENYCRMKFPGKLQEMKVRRGIACSAKPKEGLVRTIDICLYPYPEYREIMKNPRTLGELKIEIEKRSPYLCNFRVLVE